MCTEVSLFQEVKGQTAAKASSPEGFFLDQFEWDGSHCAEDYDDALLAFVAR